MSYSFEYTVIAPTTAGGSTGGNFVFTTSQTLTSGAYQITGLSGTFDGQAINAFAQGQALGFGANFFDGISTGGVNFTTVGGESVQITDVNNQLFVQAVNGNAINAPASAVAFSNTVPACFLAGTMIATAQGDVAVETLAIGDMLVTGTGALRPIKWIGRRAYSGRLAAHTQSLQPVRIRAGALSDGLPRRDLLVSGKHAMLIDGKLVAAEDLIDGEAIVRERGMTEIVYVHVEFETHDVVFAEGALSETFVDDDSRAVFHNADEYAVHYPDEAKRPAVYCAPRVSEGYALAVIRARLAKDVLLAA